jgi:beta-lactamase regulating signal transducer with metallopeptidase domain
MHFDLEALFQALAQSAAPAAITALWQGIALAAGLAFCLKLTPRVSAAHRFAFWVLTFAVVVCLPFFPDIARFLNTAGSSAIPSPIANPSSSPMFELDPRWSLAIAAFWIVASMLGAADLLIHSFRLRKLWKSSNPVDADIDLALNSRAASGRAFTVCTTQDLDRPSVIGFFAPRILIPDWLFAHLTSGELDQIVLHEAEHLRRRDDWTNLAQKLCLVLFPLNLALWFIERRLCKEREMACDEGVIRITNAPRTYAACLTSVAERGADHRGPHGLLSARGVDRRTQALSLGAWQRRPELIDRVHSILRSKQQLHPAALRLLLGVVSCSLFAASFEFARCPQLVAFVPASSFAATLPRAAKEPDALSARRLIASTSPAYQFAESEHRVYAVQARAQAPSTQPSAVHVNRAPIERKPARSDTTLRTSATTPNAPRAQLLSAKSPAPKAGTAETQQVVVFTAWEQVETYTPNTHATADYDTQQPEAASAIEQPGEASAQRTDTNAQPQPHVTRRITVTQLIFRVLPASSKSTQPAEVSDGNGWFVFQL